MGITAETVLPIFITFPPYNRQPATDPQSKHKWCVSELVLELLAAADRNRGDPNPQGSRTETREENQKRLCSAGKLSSDQSSAQIKETQQEVFPTTTD